MSMAFGLGFLQIMIPALVLWSSAAVADAVPVGPGSPSIAPGSAPATAPGSVPATAPATVFVQLAMSGHDVVCSVDQKRLPEIARSLPYGALVKALGERLNKQTEQTVAIVFAPDVPLEQALSVRVIAQKAGYRVARFFYLSAQGAKMVELVPGQAYNPGASQAAHTLVALEHN